MLRKNERTLDATLHDMAAIDAFFEHRVAKAHKRKRIPNGDESLR